MIMHLFYPLNLLFSKVITASTSVTSIEMLITLKRRRMYLMCVASFGWCQLVKG